jgi:uncharacterized protein
VTPVLSHVSVRPLVLARRRGRSSVKVSLDLGRSETAVALTDDGVDVGEGVIVGWSDIDRIARSETACFAVTADGNVEPVKAWSDELDRAYTLYPTERAPTMLISGLPMHRIKGTDPWADTEAKIAALRPVRGRVLDTATGLGYTTIALAAAGARVTTIELDPTVLEICRANPWSTELFDNPRIEQRLGDAAEVVRGLPDRSFDAVLHDPPMQPLAGQLYGGEFYRELARVLRPGGRLFHYIGNPDRVSGARTTRGVVRRLGEAGFVNLRARPQAFGVVATRG